MNGLVTFALPNIPGKDKLIRGASRLGLKVAKHSPELCIGAGIICGVGATVLACRATLKLDEALSEYRETSQNINFLRDKIDSGETNVNYSIEDAQRDKFILMVKTGVNVFKLYAPAVIAGVASIGFILGSHHILTARNAALTAAYTALSDSYKAYRNRVAEEIGEDKEMELFNGFRTKIEEHVNDKGKVVKDKKLVQDGAYSPYKRCFDETNPYWRRNRGDNQFFLAQMQAHANDKLKLNGHLFLNEVYDMLGFPHTKEGAVCGWILDGDNSDGMVSFGIWEGLKQDARDFINCYENSIWLDFNVDGVIYDII